MLSNQPFRERVLEIVSKIPRSSVLTYGEVARRAGNRQAAQAVGAIMKTNLDPKVPCHRVIRSDGTLRGYNRGGTKRKRALLEAEGWNGTIGA